MGIKKFHNKYRAAVSLKGELMQVYFDTEEQAEKYIELVKEINALKLKSSPWAIYTKKRCTAKHQDLPVGWCDYESSRLLPSGKRWHFQALSCAFKHNGKQNILRVNYGRTYSREEAILILTSRVLARLRE